MYEKFKQVNGRHPWRSVSPDGYVDYQARYRPHGRVLFFNFPLAKEMGLIPSDHPSSINKELEQVILDTFSLQIINEYDIERGKKFPPETIKPHPYMATRYLQIQHRSRQGKTSGMAHSSSKISWAEGLQSFRGTPGPATPWRPSRPTRAR